MADTPRDAGTTVRFDMVDRDMARVLAAMTGTQRLEIAFGMFTAARDMLRSDLAARHPEWSAEAVDAEVARRLALAQG